MAKTPLTNLRLDLETREKLQKICDENGITLSDGIRLAILEFIEKNSKK